MMNGAERDQSPTDEVRGPRAWLVLLITGGVLAAVVGIGVAIDRFVSSNDEKVAAPPTTVDETIDVEPVGQPSANHLFTRTTDEGIEIRVHQSDDDMFFGGNPDLDVPDWCLANGTVTSTALSANAVAQTQMPTTIAIGEIPNVQLATGGFVEASPLVSIVAQVGEDVTLARMSIGGVASDSMEPIGNVVALAIEVPAAPDDPNADPDVGFGQFPFGVDLQLMAVEFLAADGSTIRLDEQDLMNGLPMWSDPTCFSGEPIDQPEVTLPPLTLPKAGVFQPEDPALARSSIEAAFNDLYGNIGDDDILFRTVDDPSGIDLLIDQLLDGDFGDGYRDMSAEITDLIFFSPTEATFMYTLTLEPFVTEESMDQDWYRQYGRARYVEGLWLITRTTICQDIAKAGIACTI